MTSVVEGEILCGHYVTQEQWSTFLIEAIELSIVADIVSSGKGLEVQCDARISD